MSEDQQDEIEKVKQEYLKSLGEDYKYSIGKFDSQVLYLSSGALGLTLAFIKDILPIDKSSFIGLFYAAIWLFVLTILFSFIAHYISSTLIAKRIEDIENNNTDNIKESKIITRLNIFQIIGLIAGIICLVLFVNINLVVMSKENDKPRINKPAKTQEGFEKGLPVKPLPQSLKPKPGNSGSQGGNSGSGKSNESKSND